LKLQITIDGKTYEVEVEALEDDEGPRQPSYGSYQPVSSPIQSTPFPGGRDQAPGTDDNADAEKICRSPVMGLVIKVNVEPGQLVQANALIMVLEAMKMESNITAPGAGIVKTVFVAPGDSVKVNQVVVEFE
jgi:methylmalonyl-CoA carboxyltransferase small subunit